MILGRKLRNLGAWPALRLAAQSAACKDCLKCTSNCPMSLEVHGMVQAERMEHNECILCGTCVDNCAQGAVRFSFSAGK
jgi:polyferredoxin